MCNGLAIAFPPSHKVATGKRSPFFSFAFNICSGEISWGKRRRIWGEPVCASLLPLMETLYLKPLDDRMPSVLYQNTCSIELFFSYTFISRCTSFGWIERSLYPTSPAACLHSSSSTPKPLEMVELRHETQPTDWTEVSDRPSSIG